MPDPQGFAEINMKKCVSFAILCALLAGCTSTVATSGIEGVIFPARKADFAMEVTGRKDAQGWTPSKTEIAKAMPQIKTFLGKQAPSIASSLQEYRCQYFGVVVDGKKRIYCNFFRRSSWDEGWRIEPVFVLDGGDDFFQLEYDVKSKQCLNFTVNGEA